MRGRNAAGVLSSRRSIWKATGIRPSRQRIGLPDWWDALGQSGPIRQRIPRTKCSAGTSSTGSITLAGGAESEGSASGEQDWAPDRESPIVLSDVSLRRAMRPSSCPRRSRSAARSRPASARGLCLTLSPDAPHTPSEGASFFGIGRNRPGTGETARRLALQRQVRKRYGPPASRLGGGRIIVGKVRFRDPVEEKAPPQGRRRRVLFSDGAVQASTQ